MKTAERATMTAATIAITMARCRGPDRSASTVTPLLLFLVGGEGDPGGLAFRVHAHVCHANRAAVGREHVGQYLRDASVFLIDDFVDAVGDDAYRAGVGTRIACQYLIFSVEHR